MSVRTVWWTSPSGHQVKLTTASQRRYALFLLPLALTVDGARRRLDPAEYKAAVLRRSSDVGKLLRESSKRFGSAVVDTVEGKVVHVQGGEYL